MSTTHLVILTDEQGEIWAYPMRDVHEARDFVNAVRNSPELDMHADYHPLSDVRYRWTEALTDIAQMKGIKLGSEVSA